MSTVNVLKFQTLYSIPFWPKFWLFMQLLLKILGRMANSADADQTAPVCLCHFVRNFGVRKFRTFTVQTKYFCEHIFLAFTLILF